MEIGCQVERLPKFRFQLKLKIKSMCKRSLNHTVAAQALKMHSHPTLVDYMRSLLKFDSVRANLFMVR